MTKIDYTTLSIKQFDNDLSHCFHKERIDFLN